MKGLKWLRDDTFAVWVKPRAGRERIVGLRDGALHLALKAPPVEGRANEALVRFLAKRLGVRRSQVEIISGLRSRHKVVRVAGLDPQELRRRVEGLLSPPGE